MIDNYDSFTYNIVQYLGELGADVVVHRNDEISVADIGAMAPAGIVISPGPCTPNEAGVAMDVIRAFAGRIPILGVCLGHQCIGQVYGGTVSRAHDVMHGKLSAIHHTGLGVFHGLPSPFQATRYHSLIVERENLPAELEITAWTEVDGQMDEIMGLRHRHLAVEGVQFHPESILTEHGHALLRNFLHTLD
ncbi:MAG: aminodeoxychorismate/anthranilate synthase component II [Pseudomonadales bacterium]|nr:aminodeoxychorismate/anthranilate synthase component II [Pseudomonadales bacterium]MCP5184375.1 aminodeoxychorismate/anthranilate synthase component II [Pseudomonadales bacterium]